MQIENRTPHAVVLLLKDGTRQTLNPVSPPVRLTLDPGELEPDETAPIPIHGPATVRGLTGLPPPRPGVLVLVSQLAALGINFHHPDRDDIVHPVMARNKKEGRKRGDFGGVVQALVRTS